MTNLRHGGDSRRDDSAEQRKNFTQNKSNLHRPFSSASTIGYGHFEKLFKEGTLETAIIESMLLIGGSERKKIWPTKNFFLKDPHTMALREIFYGSVDYTRDALKFILCDLNDQNYNPLSVKDLMKSFKKIIYEDSTVGPRLKSIKAVVFLFNFVATVLLSERTNDCCNSHALMKICSIAFRLIFELERSAGLSIKFFNEVFSQCGIDIDPHLSKTLLSPAVKTFDCITGRDANIDYNELTNEQKELLNVMYGVRFCNISKKLTFDELRKTYYNFKVLMREQPYNANCNRLFSCVKVFMNKRSSFVNFYGLDLLNADDSPQWNFNRNHTVDNNGLCERICAMDLNDVALEPFVEPFEDNRQVAIFLNFVFPPEAQNDAGADPQIVEREPPIAGAELKVLEPVPPIDGANKVLNPLVAVGTIRRINIKKENESGYVELKVSGSSVKVDNIDLKKEYPDNSAESKKEAFEIQVSTASVKKENIEVGGFVEYKLNALPKIKDENIDHGTSNGDGDDDSVSSDLIEN